MVIQSTPSPSLPDLLTQPLVVSSPAIVAAEQAAAERDYSERMEREEEMNRSFELDATVTDNRLRINRLFRDGKPIVQHFSLTEI